MSTSPRTTPPDGDAASPTLALLLKNPWLLLLLGFTGGGGVGTLLGRPVYSTTAEESAMTREDVQDIVDASLARNNAALLQQIELLLARDKLAGAGLSVPALAPSRPQD